MIRIPLTEGEKVTAYPSPAGMLYIGWVNDRLTRCDFELPDTIPVPPDGVAREAIAQLDRYFAGELKAFNLPLAPAATPFMAKVREGLQNVPYGSLTSYSALARSLGLDARHSRAVARAVAANPLTIIVPCHRVVRADNSVGGYRGGVEAKRFLISLEAGDLSTR